MVQESNKKGLLIALYVLLVICLSYSVLYLNFSHMLTNYDFYVYEFEKNNVYENVPDADRIGKELIEFFDSDEIIPAIDEFTSDENEHLGDVKEVIGRFAFVNYIALLIFILGMSLLWKYSGKKYMLRHVSVAVFYSGATVIVLSLLSFILATRFDAGFDIVHALLFQSGTWTFPGTSVLIGILPYQFFYDITAKIVLNSFLVGVVGVVLALILRKFVENRSD